MNDPLFIQWINASVNIYFAAVATSNSIPFYIEGQELDFTNQSQLAELRLTGPRVLETSKGCFRIELDVNLMCSAKLDGNDFTALKQVGKFYSAAAGPINVYKHDGTNSPEYIGCLILRNDVDNPRDVIPWGLVQVADGPLRVNQVTLDAQYVMNLDL